MDIVTQTLLGAAVGEYTLGRKAGNKAILWGAIAGIIPDLDTVFTGFFSDVDGLFIHRGFSHSLIFAILLSPPLSWLIFFIHKKNKSVSHKNWANLVFWAAFTHPFIDYLTTYGTGAFLPFSEYRIEFSTIGIIDIFYSIPLLIGLIIILFYNKRANTRRILSISILIISTSYLVFTIANKFYINSVFKKSFKSENIDYIDFRTSPLPLTNFLWMGIAKTDSAYYIGYYSVFDKNYPNTFNYIKRNDDKIDLYKQDKELTKLIKFTKGYYHINRDKNGLYLVDLRFGKMGFDENSASVFHFKLIESDGKIKIKQSDRGNTNDNPISITQFWERLKGI
ncbi:MAG: metal-dependent hydrolase [Marinifilaceae bacterium]|jgi:inner membrane protein|nr:metal-dependent hydrolase [Marinifilaceae bacterium]